MFGRIYELLKKYPQFIHERAVWIASGRPYRTPAKIREIHEICKSNECGQFKGDHCGICKCFLHESRTTANKIAWATTECPHPAKFWGPEDHIEVVQINTLTEEDLDAAQNEHDNTKIESPEEEEKDCGCGKKRRARRKA